MRKLLIFLLICLFPVHGFSHLDNETPADDDDYNDAMGLIRHNWDAIEAVLGEALQDGLLHVVNVKTAPYSATGDGVTDDTTAVAAALVAAQTSGLPVYFPAGTYDVDTLTDFISGMTIYGDGPYDSILKSNSGNDIIEITGIASLKNLTIKHLGFLGTGSGSGRGIDLHSNASSNPYNLLFKDLNILNCGAQGLFVETEFSSRFEQIRIDNCGDNAFEIQGGNTTVISDCFVARIANTKAAYRIYGSPTMIACNGITGTPTNGDWGVFGLRISDGDAEDNYAMPILISCNIEDFTRYGCRFKAGSGGTFIGTSIQPPSGSATIALFYDSFPRAAHLPIWDGTSTILEGGGFTQSEAIHATGTPFIVFGSEPRVDSYYHTGNAASTTIPTLTTSYIVSNKDSLNISNLTVPKMEFVANNTPIALADEATPTVLNRNIWLTGGTTTITDFDDGVTGQIITIIAEHSIKITEGTNIFLSGNVDFDMTATDTLTLIQKADGKWYEISRGDNGA